MKKHEMEHDLQQSQILRGNWNLWTIKLVPRKQVRVNQKKGLGTDLTKRKPRQELMESKRRLLEASQKKGGNPKVLIREVSLKIRQGNLGLPYLRGDLRRKTESLSLLQRIEIKLMIKVNQETAESLQL